MKFTKNFFKIDTKKLLTNHKTRQRSTHASESSKISNVSPKSNKPRKRHVKKSVQHILKDLNLESYFQIFNQHEIDIHAFKLLRDADLLEMGIDSSKIRRKILHAIKKYDQ